MLQLRLHIFRGLEFFIEGIRHLESEEVTRLGLRRNRLGFVLGASHHSHLLHLGSC
jgi:hypothetical protein